MPRQPCRFALLAAALVALGLAAPLRAEFAPEAYREAIARHQKALVSIKYVVNMSLFGQDQRQDGSGQGVLVGGDGLILVPDRLVNFELPAMQVGDAEAAAGTSLRSSEFRVLLHGEEGWREARFVTRAPDLGLAWLRIAAPPEGLEPVDFSRGAALAVGDEFLTVARAGEAFAHAPFVRAGRVLGQVRLPRRAYIVDSLPGLAVDAEGRVLGVIDLDMSFMSARGMSIDMTDFLMLLTPAVSVAGATRQAAEAVAVEPPSP